MSASKCFSKPTETKRAGRDVLSVINASRGQKPGCSDNPDVQRAFLDRKG